MVEKTFAERMAEINADLEELDRAIAEVEPRALEAIASGKIMSELATQIESDADKAVLAAKRAKATARAETKKQRKINSPEKTKSE